MPSNMDVTIGEVELRLFASRAAYSVEHDTLFVADTHFGKDATFRRHGVPVPRGAATTTLNGIASLIAQTHASRLVILGDMFHARSSLASDICDSLSGFFATHRQLDVMLVRGNHDAHVGPLPTAWPIRIVPPGERLGRIALGHEPAAVPSDADVLLCGHLHPAIRFRWQHQLFDRLPSFWLHDRCLVFPAIGKFTGTHLVKPSRDDRAWIIAGMELIEYARPTR